MSRKVKKKTRPLIRALIGNPAKDFRPKLLPSLLSQQQTRTNASDKDTSLTDEEATSRYNSVVRYYYFMLCLAVTFIVLAGVLLRGNDVLSIRVVELVLLSLLATCFSALSIIKLWAHAMVMEGREKEVTLSTFLKSITAQPSILLPKTRTKGTRP